MKQHETERTHISFEPWLSEPVPLPNCEGRRPDVAAYDHHPNRQAQQYKAIWRSEASVSLSKPAAALLSPKARPDATCRDRNQTRAYIYILYIYIWIELKLVSRSISINLWLPHGFNRHRLNLRSIENLKAWSSPWKRHGVFPPPREPVNSHTERAIFFYKHVHIYEYHIVGTYVISQRILAKISSAKCNPALATAAWTPLETSMVFKEYDRFKQKRSKTTNQRQSQWDSPHVAEPVEGIARTLCNVVKSIIYMCTFTLPAIKVSVTFHCVPCQWCHTVHWWHWLLSLPAKTKYPKSISLSAQRAPQAWSKLTKKTTCLCSVKSGMPSSKHLVSCKWINIDFFSDWKCDVASPTLSFCETVSRESSNIMSP